MNFWDSKKDKGRSKVKSERTYVAFVDLKRAFPSVNRKLMNDMMKKCGFPGILRKIILQIYNGLKLHIVSGQEVAEPVVTTVGLAEGDCLSPILFALFIRNIENELEHKAPMLAGEERKSIFYADDGAVNAITAEELQKALNSLVDFCERNGLEINVSKTKIMIFGKGKIPESEFTIKGETVEIVKQFSYLGVIFTPQLSFANHVRAIVTKAKSRIAYLFVCLPLHEMSLELVVKIFETYVLAMFNYCAPIWTYKLEAKNIVQMLNTVFNTYLKRYLGLPRYAQSAALHYYCKTWPLYNAVKFFAKEAITKINFPSDSLHGHKLSFSNVDAITPYDPSAEMDDDFPRQDVFISRNRHYRRRMFRKLFNSDHYKTCATTKFHVSIEPECKCIYCDCQLTRDHTCDKDS